MVMAMGAEMEAYLLAARKAGLPADQIANFIRGRYVALPALLPFHRAARECDRQRGPVAVGMGGTRGPGKSHAALAQVALDDCQRAPGLKVLFLRKVQKSASEALEDLVRKIIAIPHEYQSSTGRVLFPNGSRILMGGFRSEGDIDKYLGLEYDVICGEEATQLSEKKKLSIEGSLRTVRDDWRARVYWTTNPDGVGLAWFKSSFIIPFRENRETETRFIPLDYHGNPFLHQEYLNYLDRLTGSLRKAWREGDWDAFAGMAFPNWRHDLHVVEPFEIPDHWICWRAVDDGYTNPMCCLWFAYDPATGHKYIYRELYRTMLTTRQQARTICEMTGPDEQITATMADPAMWGRKNLGGVVASAADEYAAEGVPLTKADNDRIQGKRRMDEQLAPTSDGQPGLMVFSSCVNFVRTLPLLVHDNINPEDVDTTGEDHAYDAGRYGLSYMSRGREVQQRDRLEDERQAEMLRRIRSVL